MNTRERILDTAIHLFNESGTGPISTNHIAQALGISPGNLYYHYRNKEAIIRAIFARMEVAWDGANAFPFDRAPTVADLHGLLTANFAVLWDYRFYYRELLALMARDPELAARYRAMRGQGLANVGALLRRCADAGLLRLPDDPATIEHLGRACWLLIDFWLPFEELGGATIAPADLPRGARFVLQLVRPYLTPAALADLDRLDPRHATKE